MMDVNIRIHIRLQLMPRTQFSVHGSILCNQGLIVALQCTLFTS